MRFIKLIYEREVKLLMRLLMSQYNELEMLNNLVTLLLYQLQLLLREKMEFYK